MVKISPFVYSVMLFIGQKHNTIQSNTKALFDASTEEVLETNAKKTKYI